MYLKLQSLLNSETEDSEVLSARLRLLKTLVLFNLLAFSFALGFYRSQRSATPGTLPSITPTAQPRQACARLYLPGYKLANLNDWGNKNAGTPAEHLVDLAGDDNTKLVRVYNQLLNDDEYAMRDKPVILRIFSGKINCLKEEFSYSGKATNRYGNELGNLAIIADFWQDGQTAIVFIPLRTGYGSGFSKYLDIINYQNGEYRVMNGPILSELSLYKFTGGQNPGREILVAHAKWEAGESHFDPHRYRLEKWVWTDSSYRQQNLGQTQNKYDLSATIDTILQTEPQLQR